MPEQKMTYEERTNQEKGKMAYRRWRPDRKKSFDYWEEYFHHDAVEHIAAQAEAIRDALMWAYEGDGTCQSLESHSNAIDEYLIDHGYKPKTE